MTKETTSNAQSKKLNRNKYLTAAKQGITDRYEKEVEHWNLKCPLGFVNFHKECTEKGMNEPYNGRQLSNIFQTTLVNPFRLQKMLDLCGILVNMEDFYE